MPGTDWLYQFTNNLTALTTANGGALTSFGLTLLSFIAFMQLAKMVPWGIAHSKNIPAMPENALEEHHLVGDALADEAAHHARQAVLQELDAQAAHAACQQ